MVVNLLKSALSLAASLLHSTATDHSDMTDYHLSRPFVRRATTDNGHCQRRPNSNDTKAFQKTLRFNSLQSRIFLIDDEAICAFVFVETIMATSTSKDDVVRRSFTTSHQELFGDMGGIYYHIIQQRYKFYGFKSSSPRSKKFLVGDRVLLFASNDAG